MQIAFVVSNIQLRQTKHTLQKIPFDCRMGFFGLKLPDLQG